MRVPISTPVPRGTTMDDRELTLTDFLAHPMTLAVMEAVRVGPAAMEVALYGLARRLKRAPISTPVPKGTAMDDHELTLTDFLSHPVSLAVMAADRVDPAALEAALSGLARKR